MTQDQTELMKGWKEEVTELRAELAAWHTQFGTTQLSHAVAERDRLRRENAKLAAGIVKCKSLRHTCECIGANDCDCYCCKANRELDSMPVGTALRDLLAPTFVLLENMKRTGITADELGAELARLRALVKEEK